MHPSGGRAGQRPRGPNQRIEIRNPPETAVTDEEVSTSHIALLLGFTGQRVGCMNSVVGATITNDGTLLVLKGGANNRIQTFDLGANRYTILPMRRCRTSCR